MASRREDPKTLYEYTERLSEKFNDQKPPASSFDPSKYLSRLTLEECGKFRDELAHQNEFKFSNFGDEIGSKEKDDEKAGSKRSGSELEIDGPPHKKRKLNKEEDDVDDDENKDDFDEDDDSDIDMSTINNKNRFKKRVKPPDKYNKAELKELEGVSIDPSQPSEFLDPLTVSHINLENECKINVGMKNYIKNYQLLNNNDIDINKEETKYISMKKLKLFLQHEANKKGITLQKDVSWIFALSLQDYLKNMFDEMNKWRLQRNNLNANNHKIKYQDVDVEKWINEENEKYAVKQEIVEAKDELETLLSEQSELDFKKITTVLTQEEENRKKKLVSLIKIAKEKQKQSQSTNNQSSQAALNVLGGDFGFNRNKKGNKKNQERRLLNDKFYVMDVINMITNHKKRHQNHFKQLKRLYLKQT